MIRFSNNSCRGFTMIEALIAVAITAIGVLAIAALQLTSKHANFETGQRTAAIQLANDLIERMRSNAGQLATYTNGATGTILTGTLAAPVPNCAGAICTGAQLTAYDLFEWDQALLGVAEQGNSGGLASATGCVVQGVAPNFVTVAIAWRGRTALSNPGSDSEIDNPAGGNQGCGADSGLYDNNGGDDAFRQVLVVRTFL
jgi:type IV pilus assembly protein PilV